MWRSLLASLATLAGQWLAAGDAGGLLLVASLGHNQFPTTEGAASDRQRSPVASSSARNNYRSSAEEATTSDASPNLHQHRLEWDKLLKNLCNSLTLPSDRLLKC